VGGLVGLGPGQRQVDHRIRADVDDGLLAAGLRRAFTGWGTAGAGGQQHRRGPGAQQAKK
jgi:hypothetical protein